MLKKGDKKTSHKLNSKLAEILATPTPLGGAKKKQTNKILAEMLSVMPLN